MPVGDRHNRVGWDYVNLIRHDYVCWQRIQQKNCQPTTVRR
jgi:hypothetical protein